MAINRRSDLIACIALGCNLAFATQTFGQTINNSFPLKRIENAQTVTVTVQAVPRQHLGIGTIDMNNLSPDILNCEVCRQRLGLPPLNSVPDALSNSASSVARLSRNKTNAIQPPTTAPIVSPLSAPQTGRILGSPGMITFATAEQMAMSGTVVEEFKPPQPEQNAIQLGALPPEVRQEFLRCLGLPPGARIMSAEVKGQTGGASNNIADSKSGTVPMAETITAQAAVNKPEAASSQLPKCATLGGAGIVSQAEATSAVSAEAESAEAVQKTATAKAETTALAQPAVPATPAPPTIDFAKERNEFKQTIEKLQKQLEEQASAFATKKALIEDEVSSKKQAIITMQQQLEEKAAKLNSQLEQFQFESKNRLEQSETANKEALVMLEKRTAEVTELQLQLKSQQEAVEKAKKENATVQEALTKEPSATEKRSSSDKPDRKKKQQNKNKKPVKPTEIQ